MAPASPQTAQPLADAVWPVMQAPAHWRTVDFISDLHLQESEPANFNAWQNYMRRTQADAVFILGDLFEVWVGDDAAFSGVASFEQQCVAVMRQAGQRLQLFFMRGNRDFLVGAQFMAHCNATLLQDPTTLQFGGHHWLLSHGDALCLADTDYQAFRATVRSAAWQRDFLAKPLVERRAIARGLRTQSEARKKSNATSADLDLAATTAWMTHARAHYMIHGHTHRPADHVLGDGLARIVLSDWDADATPPRAEVLRLAIGGGPQAGAAGDGRNPSGASVAIHRIKPSQA